MMRPAFCHPLVLTLLLASAACGRTIRPIAQYGDSAPGGTGMFRTFGQLDGVDPAISGFNVAFGAVTDKSAGIYAWIGHQLRVIADTTMDFPGTEVRFGFNLLDGTSPSISHNSSCALQHCAGHRPTTELFLTQLDSLTAAGALPARWTCSINTGIQHESQVGPLPPADALIPRSLDPSIPK